jgi:hypothetical protein
LEDGDDGGGEEGDEDSTKSDLWAASLCQSCQARRHASIARDLWAASLCQSCPARPDIRCIDSPRHFSNSVPSPPASSMSIEEAGEPPRQT